MMDSVENCLIHLDITSLDIQQVGGEESGEEGRGDMMDSVENCLIHLDITSLDIQQVVQMCWDNQLYDAMIYVFNRGMNDYINPMEKLFQVIGPPLREGKALTDEQVVMGNKLLVYISCSLAGRAYPLGDIPEDLVSQVKNQVLVCIRDRFLE
ncbi:vacuolar protein sorting-associated protein 8 homolog isoform X3 [Salmo salar]|nr:vacuolar protein sorting-associated protein 8 homolog isoform X3 [Salmo salar]